MDKKFTVPERLKPGDRVAIVAPSSGAAAMFPWVYKQGLQRMREVFELDPVEFPTALKEGKYLAENPQVRAADINRAFADKSIKAVIATIGGNDQIKILPYLDSKVISENPKMFLGLSDNTNLHLFLWNLGIVSYYGGNLMQQWAQNGKMDEFTIKYFQKALFEENIGVIEASQKWTDTDFDWSDESLLSKVKPTETNQGWIWHNFENKKVEGKLFGGCWEILNLHMLASRYMPSTDNLKGAILFLETSEELPYANSVYDMLAGLGIRGMLKNFSALLVGRPKTQHRGHIPEGGREKYLLDQRDTVIKALNEYAPNVPAVFGLDFGHTDPQLLVPNGGIARIDGDTKRIEFT